MVSQTLINRLVTEQDLITPILFKPKQFKILQKLDQGHSLTDNEQRYLRGKLGKKLKVLEGLLRTKPPEQELSVFLNSIGSYYITGLEALKHNGYGWFYEPKIMEIINTKITGKITFKEKTIRFIRVKSLSQSKTILDSKTNVRYASNDQILKDIAFTKNKYAKNIWMQMYQRYEKMFSALDIEIPEIEIDLSKYGM